MAIYHASTKPIARSAGRSAVAAAAYRAGLQLVDERTGLIHDYTKKSGVVLAEIVMPDASRADRQTLWNAAEIAEKRKDSRTAREWVVALPSELDAEQRQALALSFGADLARRYGVAADVCIHLPDREGDQRNHHAHILTTTRQVERTPEGEWVMGAKSSIELSDKKRRELGLCPAADEVTAVRELWAQRANDALERAGSSERIDARSLKAQGIDREAATHLGPTATEMERRGRPSDRGDGNRQAAANNAQRQALGAAIIDLTAERERRADPLKPYREAVKAAQGSGIDLAMAEGRLAHASALCARGERLGLHAAAIDEAGRQSAINWAKQGAAASPPPTEPKNKVLDVGRDVSELAKEWKNSFTANTENRFNRARKLASETTKKAEAIATERYHKRREHQKQRPEEPRGLLAGFKRKAYEGAYELWDRGLKAVEQWRAAREKSLRKRAAVLSRYSMAKSEVTIERRMQSKFPVEHEAVKKYEQEVKQQREEQRRQKIREQLKPDRSRNRDRGGIEF